MWWCADSLLAIAVEDGTGVSTSDPMGECGRESIILFSLLIDRKTKCVKLQKRSVFFIVYFIIKFRFVLHFITSLSLHH